MRFRARSSKRRRHFTLGSTPPPAYTTSKPQSEKPREVKAIDPVAATEKYLAGFRCTEAELMNAIIGALDGHTTMSSQALASEAVRSGLRDVLPNYAGL